MIGTSKHNWFTRNYLCVAKILETFLLPVLVFSFRLWMARIFWYAGLTKTGDWSATVFLFQYEYKVPFPEVAACLATAVELACPVLLVIGLATRFAVIPMLAMTAVINWVYPDYIQHTYWAMLLGVIFLYGPGCLSIDYWIRKRIER